MRTIVLLLFLIVFVLVPSAPVPASGGGDITFEPKGADQVKFSHDYHLKLKGLKCAACHFQKFAKGGASYEMKREAITKQGFCEHCHNGMKAFDVSSAKNCARCHVKQ